MITTVSLNPSIDRTCEIASFTYGGLNRVEKTRLDAGGKAINVALVAAELGLETQCIGFLQKDNGRFIENKLMGAGVYTDFLWRDGAVRTNIKLFDAQRGAVTEINEPGTPVTQPLIDQLRQRAIDCAAQSDFLVLTGSMPGGCPASYYADIIRAVEGFQCRVVLDADGEALKLGIAAKPFMLKPNRAELQREIGAPLDSIADVVGAARSFVDKGVGLVIVSLGREGALLVDEDGDAYYSEALDVPVKSTVGAGDSMVAGALFALMSDMPRAEILRHALACASASIMFEGTRLMEKATYRGLLGKITVRKV